MNKIYNTVCITGASVGIGRSIALRLAADGYQLLLLARREDKLQDLQQQICQQYKKAQVHILATDINQHDDLIKRFEQLPAQYKQVDVLVNNAGLALGLETADKTSWQDWQSMIETNCLSLAFLTRQLLPGMVERDRGHIINIGSIAGSYAYKGGNVYGATKAFVEQFSLNLKTDLLGTQVRSTVLMPGLLGETEFSLVRFHGDKDKAQSVYDDMQALKPEDVANAVQWVLAQPKHVNINRMEIMPVCQAPGGVAVSKKV